MTLFDLLFIFVFLSFVVSLCIALWNAIRGRRDTAIWILQRTGAFAASYLAIVIIVSLASPPRIIAAGAEQCADDWCIAVVKANRWPSPDAPALAVTVRVSSRAKRVTQAAPDAQIYLLDKEARCFQPSEAQQRSYDTVNGAAIPLSLRLTPGESITTTRVFEVPRDSIDPGLVLVHGAWPGWFIIADANSMFHKPTVMRLPARGTM